LTRSVQPYRGATAASFIAIFFRGLFQVGSVSASQEKPPP
jgi:hypothetical protein